jgi:acetyl esterase/lipase
MRNATHIVPLLALCLLATATTSAPAQQRLRERIAQRLEQRRGHDAPPAATLPAGTRVERDIAYGPDPKQRYDVYLPAHARPGAPILFMVHGGGWRNGDKRMRNVVGNKAAYWLEHGFVFVSTDYRLEPDADPLLQARDVAAAVASVQRRARQWNADPAKTVLMGHSAGAHLVALLGSDPDGLLRQAGARRPLGVVSLDSGALDVPALMGQPRLPQLYRDAFGSDPAYWRSASPQQQLARSGLPMLLVCSSTRRFPTSPCDEARRFAQRASALAVPMQVLPEPLQHGEVNDQLGLPSAYTRDVSGWIDRALTQVNR